MISPSSCLDRESNGPPHWKALPKPSYISAFWEHLEKLSILREREKKTLLLKSWGENVLQISNMQLVSYQKQVCVCETWASGDGLCDMLFYSCFTLSQRSKENDQHSGMMRVFGGKHSRSTKSTLAVTHVINGDLSLDWVAGMDQPTFTSLLKCVNSVCIFGIVLEWNTAGVLMNTPGALAQ